MMVDLPADSPHCDEAIIARERRQCRHLIRSQGADLDRGRSELVTTRARATAFADQLEAALLRLVMLEATIARLKEEQAQLAARLQAETDIRHATEAELAELLRHRGEAQILRQSLSWRLTRPLRAIRRPRAALHFLINHLLRGR